MQACSQEVQTGFEKAPDPTCIADGKRLSLQLCQRGTEDRHGEKQEGITNEYTLLP